MYERETDEVCMILIYLIRDIYGKKSRKENEWRFRILLFSLSVVCFVTYSEMHYFNYIKDIKPLMTDYFKPSFIICKSDSI